MSRTRKYLAYSVLCLFAGLTFMLVAAMWLLVMVGTNTVWGKFGTLGDVLTTVVLVLGGVVFWVLAWAVLQETMDAVVKTWRTIQFAYAYDKYHRNFDQQVAKAKANLAAQVRENKDGTWSVHYENREYVFTDQWEAMSSAEMLNSPDGPEYKHFLTAKDA